MSVVGGNQLGDLRPMPEKVDEKLSFVSAAVYQLLRIVILPSLSSFYLCDIIMDFFSGMG